MYRALTTTLTPSLAALRACRPCAASRTGTSSASSVLVHAAMQWRPLDVACRRRLYSAHPTIDDIPPEDVAAVQRFLERFSRDKIPYKTFDISFHRSGGAGGQNVNKVNTKVYMRFSLDRQAWLPSYVRQRMRQMDAKRINSRGEYLITSEKTRLQRHNIEDCLDRLWESISAAAKLPKAPDEETVKRVEGLKKAEKARNKEKKMQRSMRKSGRKKGGYDDF